MPSMTRRRFVLLSTVALLGAACGAPAEAGLRGSGTVLMPREADTSPTRVAAEPTPTLRAIPTLAPAPTPAPEPIVSSDMLPALAGGSTDAEMHVLPVLSG